MVKTHQKTPVYKIASLNMNGLRGRVLRLAPTGRKKREILVVYGHLTNLEQLLPLAQDLNKYGGVTVPDLPGFGGMHSFYRIGERPTLDNLADYLAAFVKLFYKKRHLSIVGINFGFSVVTRMLQKHPDLVQKIDFIASLDGFMHHEDFNITPGQKTLSKMGAGILSNKLTGKLAKYTIFKPVFIKARYTLSHDNELASKYLTPALIDKRITETVRSWQKTDISTHMYTTNTQYKLNICYETVNLPLTHVVYADNKYNLNPLEQHLNVVYKTVDLIMPPKSKKQKTDQKLEPFLPLPPAFKRILRQQ